MSAKRLAMRSGCSGRMCLMAIFASRCVKSLISLDGTNSMPIPGCARRSEKIQRGSAYTAMASLDVTRTVSSIAWL